MGDLGKLDSYVITGQYHGRSGTLSTEGSESRDMTWTLTVINNPHRVKLTTNSKYSATANKPEWNYSDDSYWLDGNVYRYSPDSKYWLIKPKAEIDKYYLDPSSQLESITTARFTGREEFQGLPVNHFVYGLGELQRPTQSPVTMDTAQGNILLSVDGNYLLHLDLVVTGNIWSSKLGDTDNTTYIPGVTESSYELSSLNQAVEFAIPADLPSQVKLETDVPIPPDVVLADIMYSQERIISFQYPPR